MKKILTVAIFMIVIFLTVRGNGPVGHTPEGTGPEQDKYKEISGIIKKGETLFDIFKKYGLHAGEFFKIRKASADIHRLGELYPGQPYRIIVDGNNRINTLIYWMDDDSVLNITRTGSGFCAEKKAIEYEKRILHRGGVIEDNLIASMGNNRENLMLAFQLSDILAWDVDFASDLRRGDVFKVIVEGLYHDGEFRKYGNILSAEFINDGTVYRAYRFGHGDKADYYDDRGKSLKKIFLKAPLSFRRISSGFSPGRLHPILKIFRPHHGVDYAAPAGTPVSVSGDGTVVFSGCRGGYGNLVVVRHRNGYRTYYGHLSRIGSGIVKGEHVEQGRVVGYVGATGLATGPHLHYEMRIHNEAVNPLTANLPRGGVLPKRSMAEFGRLRDGMAARLASITPAVLVAAGKGPAEPGKTADAGAYRP